MDEDVLSDVVPSNIVSRQVSPEQSLILASSLNNPISSPVREQMARVNSWTTATPTFRKKRRLRRNTSAG
jgi:hypothetical protein